MQKPDKTPALARPLAVLALCGLTAACAAPRAPLAVDALPASPMAGTRMLAEVKDNLDALDQAQAQGSPVAAAARVAPAVATPHLTARGFAQVAGQPGHTLNEKRLLAIRAARLDALRDLTEQVHGIRISANSLLRDAVLRDDQLAAQVQGTLRGARTLSVEPRGDDGYIVTMELDADTLAYVVRAVGAGS